jgi:hypothetical protein
MHSDIEGRAAAAADGPSVAERFRRLPEAILLTAGYYASRVPVLSELIRRLD